MQLTELETPVPVVDVDRMDANLRRMAEYTRSKGLSLRPHVKTHKSPRVAAEQVRLGAVGLTCATPHEASVMSDVADDLLLAYPPVGAARLHRLLDIPDHARLTVALDSAEAVHQLAVAAADAGREIGVYVELDLGMRRVGTPDPAEALSLVKLVVERPALRYEGIAFYPGHIRGAVNAQDDDLSRLGDALHAALETLAADGLSPRVVSGGSTPTAWRSHEVSGVTEVRPGTYVYNDRTTAEMGACEWDDCALTVLATVVSTAVPGQAVIDAGTKALGREPLRAGPDDDSGFGVLMEHREVRVARMSEEHGVLDLTGSDWRPRVGEQVRVIPNHVCVVVHLNDVVVGVRGDLVVEKWPVAARGRGYDVSAR